MTTVNNIIKRAMSLMKAHVQYSQNLAAEFADLIQDYEVLVESPAEIELDSQEEFDLEAVCAVFEELMDNEPINVLRALRPFVDENAEAGVIKHEAVEQSTENAQEEFIEQKTVQKLDENVEEIIKHEAEEQTNHEQSVELISKKPSLELPGYVAVQPSVKINNCVLSGRKKVNSIREGPFECSICKKRFCTKKKLGKHNKLNNEECTVCRQRFCVKKKLDNHTRAQTGEKPLECIICRERRITPFECTVCSKRFNSQKKLDKHILAQTREKPLECNICSRKFCEQLKLVDHVRGHTGEKAFECAFCGKRFCDRTKLIKHLKAHM